MYKVQQFFNYLTLILAILTVGFSIYSLIEKKRLTICLILLLLTLLFNEISRIYNKQNMNLTKSDKELLEKLKEEKENAKKIKE